MLRNGVFYNTAAAQQAGDYYNAKLMDVLPELTQLAYEKWREQMDHQKAQDATDNAYCQETNDSGKEQNPSVYEKWLAAYLAQQGSSSGQQSLHPAEKEAVGETAATEMKSKSEWKESRAAGIGPEAEYATYEDYVSDYLRYLMEESV